jgi:hypothetical protein
MRLGVVSVCRSTLQSSCVASLSWAAGQCQLGSGPAVEQNEVRSACECKQHMLSVCVLTLLSTKSHVNFKGFALSVFSGGAQVCAHCSLLQVQRQCRHFVLCLSRYKLSSFRPAQALISNGVILTVAPQSPKVKQL